MPDHIKEFTARQDFKKRQLPRRLSDRSHLTIEFPQSEGRVIRTFVPFLENPTISEKGKANLNSYNLVGRAGQLFSYGGADSRKLSVSFNITLLHVIAEEAELNDMFKKQFKLFFSETERAQSAFNLVNELEKEAKEVEFANSIGMGDGRLSSETRAKADAASPIGTADVDAFIEVDHADLHRTHYLNLIKEITGFDPDEAAEGDLSFIGKGFNSFGINTGDQSGNIRKLNETINLVYLWVNLIRASVMNRSDNTTFGPPIVRLTHGGMYNNVPCLLQDYSINIVEEAGYDVQTMVPKRLEISLNLVESRTGNFGKFQAGELELGDNLTGWESVIEKNNMDPYNGFGPIGRADYDTGVKI